VGISWCVGLSAMWWAMARWEYAMRLKRILVLVSLVAFVTTAKLQAWSPQGWCYSSWPYMYSASGGWYYMDTGDTGKGTLYALNTSSGTWWLFGNSAMRGPTWLYFSWPYAFCSGNSAWYYLSESDVQWCCQVSTGDWSIMEAPAYLPSGTWRASSPSSYELSVTVNANSQVSSATLKVYYNDGWLSSDSYTFGPKDITQNGSSFVATEHKFSSNSVGIVDRKYDIEGTFQANGTITGTWRGSYLDDPSGPTIHTNVKNGNFTARR
jgi:hypothetical protein